MAIPYSRTIFGGLPWYSVLVVGGIVLAIWLAGREEKRLGLPKDTAVDLALVVVPCGIVGARLYYVVMSWPQFAQNPLSVLYVWQGGLAIYGGVIGGAVGAWCCSRHKKISFASVADMIAPGLLLAQAVGRWGNYFNMEAYGPLIQDARLQFFPFGVLIPVNGVYQWHMAAFFYESVWNLCSFIVLWLIRKRQTVRGNVFCWYLVFYGSGRFVIEQLRQDSLYIGSLRASQWLSLILCLTAACILIMRTTHARKDRRFLAVICLILWLSRWFFLDQPLVYGVLLVASGAMATGLVWRRWTFGVLAAMLVLDGAGLALSAAGWSLAACVQPLLCSITLAGYLLSVCVK